MKANKIQVGDEVWMESFFGPRIRVRVVRNEFKVTANTGERLEEVHAYNVSEVSGKGRKWSLVPATRLFSTAA